MIYIIHKTLLLLKNHLVKISNFWSNNYFEYESNGDRTKTISVEEYLNKNSV